MRLANAGPVHGKFRRMITMYLDITAPLYWWKEFDTYKVGTVANSCSTMHKIQEKEFSWSDFSIEHLINFGMWGEQFTDGDASYAPAKVMGCVVSALNGARERYLGFKSRGPELEAQAKQAWWQMIQLLPSSYNQKRTVMLNYEVLTNIYKSRRNHKLDEWHVFCDWIESLPYSELITGEPEFLRKEFHISKEDINDVLVVRINALLSNKDQEHVRKYVIEQLKTGVVVLPSYCEVMVVPKDIKIKFEGGNKSNTY